MSHLFHPSSGTQRTRPPKEKAIWHINALPLAAGLLLLFTVSLDVSASAQTPETAENTVCNGFCPLNVPRLNPSAMPPDRSFPESMIPRIVVRVTNSHQNGYQSYADKGTGVFIQNSLGKTFVLTAAHIFNDGTGEISVRSDSGFRTSADLVLLDRLWDIALLETATAPDAEFVEFAQTAPKPGDRSLIAGFGSDDRLAVTRGNVIGYAQTRHSATYETLKTTGAVRQGDSGGPVLNPHGELTGIVWGTDGACSYATYSDRIWRILVEKTSLRFESSEPILAAPPVDDSDSPPADEIKAPKRLAPIAPTAPVTADGQPDHAENNRLSAPEFTGDPVEIIIGWILKTLLPALGVTVPSTVLAAYWIWRFIHRARKRKSRRKKKETLETSDEQRTDNSVEHDEKGHLAKTAQKVAKTIVDSNNDYALELNDLYNLNGRNSVADATLGRLYDTELANAESSSDNQRAQFAADLRRKIKKELCRIHSEVPIPTSENDQ